MIVNTKEWTAHIVATPDDPHFKVHGLITVANYAAGPKLTKSRKQDNSNELCLDLGLEHLTGNSRQVEHHIPVEYKEYGLPAFSRVNIFLDGKLLHHIDKILITY